MLTHKGIWHAIDALAARHGMSPSGLAKKAGLDPTTFNVSKRVSREGKPRWPSTESVAKVLEATGSSLGAFVGLVGEHNDATGPFRVPLIGLSEAAKDGYFDESGLPSGDGWDEVAFPEVHDPDGYALEVNGDGLAPVYRDGDIIVVSPAAGIRRGDRVVVRTRTGDMMARQLLRRTAHKVELTPFNPAHPGQTLDVEDIAWIGRIVWASQ